MEDSVCIIGAGMGGLSMIKSCLEEGLHPVCYEPYNEVGGIWNHYENQHRTDGGGRVYTELQTNVSKEMSTFSDFPAPKDFPLFLSWQQMFIYLQNYADNFNLRRHIQFRHKVKNVEKLQEIGNKIYWRVTIEDIDGGTMFTKTYSRVAICIGRNAKPLIPSIQGFETFKGELCHCSRYNSEDVFTGKTVLVIGSSSSGVDIADGAGKTAKKVFMCSRNGIYSLSRFNRGLPFDMVLVTRLTSFISRLLPKFILEKIMRKKFSEGFDHKLYGIQSKYAPNSPLATLSISEHLQKNIAYGKVTVVRDITEIDGRTVHIEDGRTLENIDVIYLATGYLPYFPFISDDILPDNPEIMMLHDWIFPLTISDPSSMAVIGCMPFVGNGIASAVEMQARYAAQVMSGVFKLPSIKAMKDEHQKQRHRYYVKGCSRFLFKLPIRSYVESLSKVIGVYPSFFKLLFRDPKLAWVVLTGPMLACHYRIFGRHPWKGARGYALKAFQHAMSGLNSLT